MNVAIGSAVMALGFAGAALGAGTLALALKSGRQHLLRAVPLYVSIVVASAVIGVLVQREGLHSSRDCPAQPSL